MTDEERIAALEARLAAAEARLAAVEARSTTPLRYETCPYCYLPLHMCRGHTICGDQHWLGSSPW